MVELPPLQRNSFYEQSSLSCCNGGDDVGDDGSSGVMVIEVVMVMVVVMVMMVIQMQLRKSQCDYFHLSLYLNHY